MKEVVFPERLGCVVDQVDSGLGRRDSGLPELACGTWEMLAAPTGELVAHEHT